MVKGSLLSVLFALCQLILLCEAGPQCYSCDRVSQAQDCNVITTCGDSQKCYAQRFIGSRLNEYFKLGCVDVGVCTQNQFSLFGVLGLGKREQQQSRAVTRADVKRNDNNEDMVLCLQCCDGDNCNNHLCGAPPATFRRCFDCTDVNSPKDCERVTECSRNELCSTHKQPVITGEFHYQMNCMPEFQCQAMEQAIGSASTTLGCFKCCNGSDYCNFNICDGVFAKTTLATPVPPTHPIKVPTTTNPTSTTTAMPAPSTLRPAPVPLVTGHKMTVYANATTLNCHVVETVRELIWLFNGNKTLPAGVTTEMKGNHHLFLHIAHLNESNAGIYSCLVLALNGQIAQTTVTVDIKPTPAKVVSLIKEPQGILAPGVTFAMECTVIGWPKPDILWTFVSKDGSRIIPTDVEFSSDKLNMVVTKGGYSAAYHDGTWTCSASNTIHGIHYNSAKDTTIPN